MALSAKLVVVGGDVTTSEIPLRLPATIGRGRGQSIVLPHPLVSRQHCELFERDGMLMVRDLGSLNGTFVNNRRVSESPLGPGELLTIGTVTFRAVYEPAKASGGPEATVRTAPGDATVRAAPASGSAATGKASSATRGGDAPAQARWPGEVAGAESAADKTERLFDWEDPLPLDDDEDELPPSAPGR
jgi:pSer/pThr/pTyr-binding forkhead associated (FHA) protein